MVAPFVMNATVLTYVTSGAEQHVSSTLWYETITVINNSGVPVYIAVDGGTATNAGASEYIIQNNAQAVFGNEQLLPQPNETYAGAWNAGATKFSCGNMGSGNPTLAQYNGVASGARSQSQACNWTTQQGMVDANGTPTYCSVIPNASTSGTVTVTFQ
jgi:hypothetical protein